MDRTVNDFCVARHDDVVMHSMAPLMDMWAVVGVLMGVVDVASEVWIEFVMVGWEKNCCWWVYGHDALLPEELLLLQ